MEIEQVTYFESETARAAHKLRESIRPDGTSIEGP